MPCIIKNWKIWNSMEFDSQICTTREQSERLLSLGLKKETADMYISNGVICAKPYSEVMEFMRGVPCREVIIPAWSFARLLDIFLTNDLYRNILFVYKENHVEYLIRKIEEYAKEGLINKEYMEERL